MEGGTSQPAAGSQVNAAVNTSSPLPQPQALEASASAAASPSVPAETPAKIVISGQNAAQFAKSHDIEEAISRHILVLNQELRQLNGTDDKLTDARGIVFTVRQAVALQRGANPKSDHLFQNEEKLKQYWEDASQAAKEEAVLLHSTDRIEVREEDFTII